MKPTKQPVYLPVKENGNYSIYWNKDKIFNHAIMKEGYFFTEEQLNQLLSDVIKDAVSTAAKKAVTKDEWEGNTGSEYCDVVVDRQSITNTFDITYQKHKV